MTSAKEHNFEFVTSVTVDGDIPLSKYRSKKTGITVFIVDVKGPMVNGYLCLATEVHDDDGIPHTLEHLIFMGSEKYPYKGILDILANRCLASGTNAWTSVDHTCYTMTTAGSDGFLNLLPIYLDHILYPTLTDSAFTTEVYHINGEGDDGGIVYCEMQGRENQGSSKCILELRRAIYPGDSGYRCETGGIMKNLRESTTNEKIKKYHKAVYCPENLCVIITGQVDAEDVFKAMQPMEEKILAKGECIKLPRPWQSPIPPLQGPLDIIVPYPSDDDKYGMVYMGWRGPPMKNHTEILAMKLLLNYLTDTSVAPLQKAFIEIDDPFCSMTGGTTMEGTETIILIVFMGVPKQKLQLIKQRLQETLQKLADEPDSIDMKRFATVINNFKLSVLSSMENNAHKTIAMRVIEYFLYGNSVEDLHTTMQQIQEIEKFIDRKAEFWQGLIKKYLLDGHMIMCLGEASPETMESITQSEKERIATRCTDLGKEGLQNKGEELKEAIKINEKETPASVLTSVNVPDPNSVHFHSVIRSCSYMDTKDAVDGFPLSGLPYNFQLDDIKTVFVQIEAHLDTRHMSPELRMYLPLWRELLIVSPIMRNGKLIPYEDVVAELEEDTITKSVSLGFGGSTFTCGSHSHIAIVTLEVEPEKYIKGVKWLKEILSNTQFVPERISVVAKKMMNNVDQTRRAGDQLAYILLQNMGLSSRSNAWIFSPLRQHAFLVQLLQRLETNPEEVIAKFEEIRKLMSDITIHMTADVKKLSEKGDPRTPWTENLLQDGISTKLGPGELQSYEVSEPLDRGLPTGVILGIGAIESSFLEQMTPVNLSYTHADVPALYVLLNYLGQMEGPLWKQIRGQGLAYSYQLDLHLDKQMINFTLYKSTNVIGAYKVAKSVVENHVTGKVPWDEALLESSRSSLMYSVIKREETVGDVSVQSACAYYRNLDMAYNRNLLDLISKVEIKDLQRVGPLYVTPLFDPSKSRCAICCNPSKVEDIVTAFAEMSRKLTVLKSLEEDLLVKF